MQRQEIRFNLSEIPEHVREDLARATLELVKSILNQPGGRVKLDRETKRRKLQNQGK